ncbi:hypothetical protein HNY73_021214 [Argiope bruennichi]|uniref:Uncharacterized protein n=1 Tax=Argiope bruennichi TaxID=94029 RepID=A0A8T0EAM1_ARGBR|nr:hypothetical protein HNY73_021214 [Argiope bruennichi]
MVLPVPLTVLSSHLKRCIALPLLFIDRWLHRISYICFVDGITDYTKILFSFSYKGFLLLLLRKGENEYCLYT